MRKISAYVPALLIGAALLITDGATASMVVQPTVDRSMIWLAQTQTQPPSQPQSQTTPHKKPTKPKVVKPIPKTTSSGGPIPAGACDATKGQTGPCTCSTSVGATAPTCTGNCCQ